MWWRIKQAFSTYKICSAKLFVVVPTQDFQLALMQSKKLIKKARYGQCRLKCQHSNWFGGRNSSLVVFRLAVHSVAGSILHWGNFPVQGIFPLELTWVQTPFPQKTLSDESINRGLVCAHMHFIARTQKILTFMS